MKSNKKYYLLGLLISFIFLLLLLIVRKIMNSMIVSWFSGPALLLWFSSWFRSELSINILSSILFVAYYGLFISKIIKYYYAHQKIRIVLAIFIIILINTILLILAVNY